MGGQLEPVGIQLAEASQQVVPAPHSAREQKPPLPSTELAPSIPLELPSPWLPPSPAGAIDEPHAAAIAERHKVNPIEVSPNFFMGSIVAHTFVGPAISGRNFHRPLRRTCTLRPRATFRSPLFATQSPALS